MNFNQNTGSCFVSGMLLTADIVKEWLRPPIQRDLTINVKMRAMITRLKLRPVIDGTLLVAVFDGKFYLCDGQHRVEAFLRSGIAQAHADVKFVEITSEQQLLAQLGDLFVLHNSRIVGMQSDDFLRAMEPSTPALKVITATGLVGYSSIRRGINAPTLSMSVLLRSWCAAKSVALHNGGAPAREVAADMSVDEAAIIARAVRMFHKAWGRDRASVRLWGQLNLVVCLWLWRCVVLEFVPANARFTSLNDDLFCKGMMSLGASSDYMDWLVGRNLTERNRGPCYRRMKPIVVARLKTEMKDDAVRLPQPAWASE